MARLEGEKSNTTAILIGLIILALVAVGLYLAFSSRNNATEPAAAPTPITEERPVVEGTSAETPIIEEAPVVDVTATPVTEETPGMTSGLQNTPPTVGAENAITPAPGTDPVIIVVPPGTAPEVAAPGTPVPGAMPGLTPGAAGQTRAGSQPLPTNTPIAVR